MAVTHGRVQRSLVGDDGAGKPRLSRLPAHDCHRLVVAAFGWRIPRASGAAPEQLMLGAVHGKAVERAGEGEPGAPGLEVLEGVERTHELGTLERVDDGNGH